MNIFAISDSPAECAKMHMDRHVCKMAIEYAQILSTAQHVLNPTGILDPNLYKMTHINHPSTIWARTSFGNYNWLYRLWMLVLEEYTFRYGKIHATSRLAPLLSIAPKKLYNQNWKTRGMTEFSLALPAKYKSITHDKILLYQYYYFMDKSHLAKWKNREIPWWYNKEYFIERGIQIQ